MKFEVIKHNKIKVIVETQDLKEWGISAEEMAKNTPETREIFFEMLRRAEKETGFSYSNSRLVVEAAVNSLMSELTLFVTKVDNEEEQKLFEKLSTQIKFKKEKPKKEEKQSISTIIELDDFEDVVKMCHVMRECFWGTLYSYNDKYYMTMLPSYIRKASEFGSVCPEGFRTVVEEHGKAIIKNSAFLFIRNRFSE